MKKIADNIVKALPVIAFVVLAVGNRKLIMGNPCIFIPFGAGMVLFALYLWVSKRYDFWDIQHEKMAVIEKYSEGETCCENEKDSGCLAFTKEKKKLIHKIETMANMKVLIALLSCISFLSAIFFYFFSR